MSLLEKNTIKYLGIKVMIYVTFLPMGQKKNYINKWIGNYKSNGLRY